MQLTRPPRCGAAPDAVSRRAWQPDRLRRQMASMPITGLRIVRGKDAGAVIALEELLVLGRDEGADLVLDDEEASKRHARVTLRDGHAVIEDLGSTNGTFVNEQRISEPRRLEPDDSIRIGQTVLELSRSPPTADTPALAEDAQRTRARPITAAAVERGPVGRLEVLRGPGAGQSLELTRAAVLGRDPRCELAIPDGEVSREHLRIGVEDGGAVVVDIGATNGTYINGERLLGRRRLRPGDRLEIGRAVLEYRAPGLQTGAAARAQPTSPSSLRQVLADPTALTGPETSSRKWWTLAVVCATVGMLFLDTTIVTVALPTITKDLKASFSELQWLVDAYALTLAVALLTAGSLSDMVGRRHVFVAGIALFTLCSMACGLATTALMLDIFRALQGIGGAMMLATSLALIAQEFPPAERAVAYGAWGATTGVAAATGPLIGGVLTSSLSWPWIFYVNVPIGVVALIVTLAKLVNLPGPRAATDVPGFVGFSASMFLLLFGIIRGPDDGWGSATIVGCFAGSALLGASFVAFERRREAPMLPLRLFRNRTLIGAAIVGFALSATVLSVLPYVTLWLQSILGYSAFQTGLRLLPMSLVAVFLSPWLGRLEKRVPLQIVIAAGLIAFAAGLALMSRVDAASGWTALLGGFVLIGVGWGFVNIPLESAAVGVVPPWQSGTAAGVNTTFRQLGFAAGVAALGAVLQSVVLTKVERSLAATPLASGSARLASSISAGDTQGVLARTRAAQRPLLDHVARLGFAAGLSEVLMIAAVVAVIGALSSVLLIRHKDLHEVQLDGEPPVPSSGP